MQYEGVGRLGRNIIRNKLGYGVRVVRLEIYTLSFPNKVYMDKIIILTLFQLSFKLKL